MRFKFILCLLTITICTYSAVAAGEAEEPLETGQESSTLVIYTYDSFASEWGPGPVVIPKFEEMTGIPVELLALGDAGQALSKVILEKENPGGDIILGIDNNMLPQAMEAGVLTPYTPDGLSKVPAELVFDSSGHLTPYDYGNFAIIYDSDVISSPPESLEDLAQNAPEDSIILMDPRTSSPGFGFLLWTIDVYGDEYLDYWKRLEDKILTITDGWDSGYGLFTKGEAPMVLSYTTSPAYHVEYEKTDRYRAAVFSEGNYGQIEGAGIIKEGPNPDAAQKFIDFMISLEFQEEIPLTNWMYPVREDAALPDSFEYAPKPEQTLLLDTDVIAEKREQWIRDWTAVMTE